MFEVNRNCHQNEKKNCKKTATFLATPKIYMHGPAGLTVSFENQNFSTPYLVAKRGFLGHCGLIEHPISITTEYYPLDQYLGQLLALEDPNYLIA